MPERSSRARELDSCSNDFGNKWRVSKCGKDDKCDVVRVIWLKVARSTETQ